jgi:hypothetical protein
MKKLTMVLSMFALAALAWGCCGGGATSDAELEKALDAAFDEALKEMEAEMDTAGEAAGDAAAEAAPGDPCSGYSKCCTDYIEALSNLPGYPAESVEAAKTGCQAAETYKDTPGMEETCKTMLDGMKLSMESMGSFPGWETPASCK